MSLQNLLLIWGSVTLGAFLLTLYVLVIALRACLHRNERLTMMLAVREAHGGKGTDAARAHVATIKEMSKKYDRLAAGGTKLPLPHSVEGGKDRGGVSQVRITTP